MNILILMVISTCLCLCSILNKQYNIVQKEKPYFYAYTSVASFFSAIVFAFMVPNWRIDWNIIKYGTIFATVYCLATIFLLKAMKYGSLALTALITSYSLLIPTVYGIIFLNESINITKIISVIILLVSIYLTTMNKNEKCIKINSKWVLFVSIGFFTNGLGNVTQRIGQFHTSNSSLMMVVALVEATIVSFILHCFSIKGNFKKKVNIFVPGIYLPAIGGIVNGTLNLLVIVLNKRMPASILFPAISSLELIMLFFFSKFLFKEKFSRKQIIGFIFGIISIILLNL